MPEHDGLLAVGGSAGSVEALIELVARLPADLPVPVVVTVHVGGQARSSLPTILARSGPLPAAHARDGERLRGGRIYVAPPDVHLLATAGVARLSSGPRVNRYRPAIDVMFASVARWGRGRVVAVVLSGALDDGAVGAALVARAGGRVVVQEPADAPFDSMPRAALSAVADAVTAPAVKLADVVGQSLRELAETAARGAAQDEEDGQVRAAKRMGDGDDPDFLAPDETRLTRLSCPECGGGLAKIDVAGLRYYRCHVGHQYAPQSLEAAQREAVEAKLWAAAAALEEHAALARHLATHDAAALGPDASEGYRQVARRSADAARSLLSGLENREHVPLPEAR